MGVGTFFIRKVTSLGIRDIVHYIIASRDFAQSSWSRTLLLSSVRQLQSYKAHAWVYVCRDGGNMYML